MSKTLEQLFGKARRNGESNKNGRPAMYGGHGQLQEQWHVTDDGNTVTVRHWGTQIIEATRKEHKVIGLYGQSKTDRDALNQIFEYLGISMHVHYYPSRETLEVHADDTERLVYTI